MRRQNWHEVKLKNNIKNNLIFTMSLRKKGNMRLLRTKQLYFYERKNRIFLLFV